MVELAIDFCEPESRRDTCFPKLRDAEFPDMEGGPVAIGKNPSGDDTIDSGFSAKVYHHLGRNGKTIADDLGCCVSTASHRVVIL